MIDFGVYDCYKEAQPKKYYVSIFMSGLILAYMSYKASKAIKDHSTTDTDEQTDNIEELHLLAASSGMVVGMTFPGVTMVTNIGYVTNYLIKKGYTLVNKRKTPF